VGRLQLLSHHLEYDLEEVVRLLYRMQNDVQRMNDNVIIHHETQIVVKVFRIGTNVMGVFRQQ
jgi:ParB family chromosome partitioning protein